MKSQREPSHMHGLLQPVPVPVLSASTPFAQDLYLILPDCLFRPPHGKISWSPGWRDAGGVLDAQTQEPRGGQCPRILRLSAHIDIRRDLQAQEGMRIVIEH